MPYFRLIKETDTKIRVSNKGIEIPGTECIHVDKAGPGFLDRLTSSDSRTRTITFEDGRTETVKFAYSVSCQEYVFLKKRATSD